MDTGMTNLRSGGEAKASPADRADTDPLDEQTQPSSRRQARRSIKASAAERWTLQWARNANPTLLNDTGDAADASWIGTAVLRVGQGETAAYGERAGNAPAPSEPSEDVRRR